MKGYEVASGDLRTFAGILNDQATAYGDLSNRTEGGTLDFWVPVVGLFFKSDFNNAARLVKDALDAFAAELATAGTALKTVADNYEEQERAAAAAAAAAAQQTSNTRVP